MFKVLKARFRQKYRTGKFPESAPPNLPPHFCGVPEIHPGAEKPGLAEVCPTGAISVVPDLTLDLGRCIFCGKCAEHSPEAVRFTREYRMGTARRESLVLSGRPYAADAEFDAGIRKLYGHSLKIRQVSAGGCAACELDFNVLHTLAWDMGRFGIQAVASPRHADCILVTGPVSRNMLTALQKTFEAMPRPNLVIACGTCAVSGGLFAGSPEVNGALDGILPVDLYVPGCPPHPATLLEALLRFIGRKA